MPLGFSYVRWSSAHQAEGDSLRRQTAATEKWCQANGVELDRSLVLRDEGRSALKRANWDTYALAEFLRYVESGRVPKGSYLIVENLDRISREHETLAVHRFTGILLAGIRIVQLKPEHVFTEKSDAMDIMRAVLELSRGHSESALKVHRCGEAWADKQKQTAQTKKLLTKMLPGWITCDGGKLGTDPTKVETVKRIFALCLDGLGVHSIAKKLNDEKVPVLRRTVFKGRSVKWSTTTVYQVLTSPATVGTFVPYRCRSDGRKPEGEPVSGYFPRVVDDLTFHAAQNALKTRAGVGRGRRGKHIGLLSGLLVDARGGGPMGYRRSGKPTIVPNDAKQAKGGKWISFPADWFETGLLSLLREVRVIDVRGDSKPARKVETLAGELAKTDDLIRKWSAKMDDPDLVDVVAEKMAELNRTRKKQAEALADAQREAADPASEALGKFKSLAELLETDNSDEMRLKVRAALRRV
ncbi:MAG TPA: recombinase family protein, partial [Gemmataceae bacterium]|nr:recombinase family protein [Gemmataceae bacterium]